MSNYYDIMKNSYLFTIVQSLQTNLIRKLLFLDFSAGIRRIFHTYICYVCQELKNHPDMAGVNLMSHNYLQSQPISFTNTNHALGTVIQWLSLPHNFIQQSLNSILLNSDHQSAVLVDIDYHPQKQKAICRTLYIQRRVITCYTCWNPFILKVGTSSNGR